MYTLKAEYFAQDSLRYEKVIQCEGVSAGDTYKRGESLFGSMPKSSGRSIQAHNPENKTLEINEVTVF